MKRIAAIAVLMVCCHVGLAQPFQTILITYKSGGGETQVVLVDRHRQTSHEFQGSWSGVWDDVLAFYTGEDATGAEIIDVVTYFGQFGWQLAAIGTDPDTNWVSYYFQLNCLYHNLC